MLRRGYREAPARTGTGSGAAGWTGLPQRVGAQTSRPRLPLGGRWKRGGRPNSTARPQTTNRRYDALAQDTSSNLCPRVLSRRPRIGARWLGPNQFCPAMMLSRSRLGRLQVGAQGVRRDAPAFCQGLARRLTGIKGNAKLYSQLLAGPVSTRPSERSSRRRSQRMKASGHLEVQGADWGRDRFRPGTRAGILQPWNGQLIGSGQAIRLGFAPRWFTSQLTA